MTEPDTPATEAVSARYHGLDTWESTDVLHAMWEGQAVAVAALRPVLPALARAGDAMAARLAASRHGRFVYAGAGTSARLGVQDGVELVPTFHWPPERLAYLNSQTMSSTNSETILSFVKRTNIYTLLTGQELMIRAVRQLSTAGASGGQRMVAYKRSPRTLKFHLPMPHKFLPIWQNGPMNFLVPGIMRTGGVEILKPGAMRYADAF